MAKDKEDDWMAGISNETICNYYYVMFIVMCVLVALVLLSEFSAMSRNPKAGMIGLLRTLPTLVLAVVNTLFIYIICSRALLK